MIIVPFSSRSCGLRAVLLASALAGACEGGGCGGEPKGEETPPPGPAPTQILVDLPQGIDVALNGKGRGVTPLAALEVEPGAYSVTLVAGCKTLDVQLDVRAHQTETIDLARATGLGLVPFEVVVKDKEGQPLEHTVALDDEVLGGGKGSSTTMVPPCKARLRVASEGLGGFIEDVDFGTEEPVRELVLAPGPDMVRIRGGSFTPGTGGALMKGGCSSKPYYEVKVKDFDIDRTEITVEQWLACRKAGGCPSDFAKWNVTASPSEYDYPRCNIEILQHGAEPPVRSGREGLPMNCVAQWEAEDYCRWAGKRLLTDVEWEFAARSGRSDYTFPWGNDFSPCTNKDDVDLESACNFGDGKLKPPCSYPKMNTEQGVCDMANNLYELVTYEEFPGRKKRSADYGHSGPWLDPESKQYRLGDAYSSVGSCLLSIDGFWDRWEQVPQTGFRCARDIRSSRPQE